MGFTEPTQLTPDIYNCKSPDNRSFSLHVQCFISCYRFVMLYCELKDREEALSGLKQFTLCLCLCC